MAATARELDQTSQPALHRARIVAAAIRIVDAEGVDALSLRRLAVELGSGATSVYRHVRDRDELLDLALDAVTSELELPPPDIPWQEGLALTARRLRGLFHRHPNFVIIRATRVALAPTLWRHSSGRWASFVPQASQTKMLSWRPRRL